MKMKTGFGKRVAQVRRDHKLSKVAFAKAVLSPGASAKNIGRIEAEEVTPRVTTLEKIARFGGVSMEWLQEGACVLKEMDIVRTGGVGERIAQARRSRGMTCLQLSLAAEMGASSKNVSRLESGEHRPRMQTLNRLAKVLKMPVGYLAYGND